MNSTEDASTSNSHTTHVGIHQRALCEELWNMRTEGVLCDAVLEVEGKQLCVHRVVLSAGSPYLKQRCTNPDAITPCGAAAIHVDNYSYNVCLKAVEYLYTGRVEEGLTEQHLTEEFKQLCQQWDLDSLPLEGVSRLTHTSSIDSTHSVTPTKRTHILGDEPRLKTTNRSILKNNRTDPLRPVSTQSARGQRCKGNSVDKTLKCSKQTLTSIIKLTLCPLATNNPESKDGHTQSDSHEKAKTSAIVVEVNEHKAENCDDIGCDNYDDNADYGSSLEDNANDNIEDDCAQDDNGDVGSETDNHIDDSQGKLRADPKTVTLKKKIKCRPCIETSSQQKSDIAGDESQQPQLSKKNACLLCTLVFTSRAECLAHRKKAHPKLRKVWCEPCKTRFPDRNLLQLHNMEQHWEEGMKLAKKYLCSEPGCSFSSFIYATWHKHKNLHNAEPRVCEICGKTLKNEFTLKQHVENMHTRVTTYPCDACDKTFSTKGNLKFNMSTPAATPAQSDSQLTSFNATSGNEASRSASQVLYTETLSAARELIQRCENQQDAKFVVDNNYTGFGTAKLTDPDTVKCAVRWKDTQANCRPQIPADATPFLILGKIRLACTYGPHYTRAAREDKKAAKEAEGQIFRHYFQDTKKLGCPAIASIRHIICFRDLSFLESPFPSVRRNELRQKIREGSSIPHEHRFYVHLPSPAEHTDHSTDEAHTEARHMDTTTREKLVCPQCAFVCWCKPSMSEHILLKHNELMPARNLHQCENCDFKTTIRTKMKEHMRAHNVVERLACSVCGKTYKSAKLLNRHMKMHDNTAKVTACPYCDYTTLHGVGTLSNHLRFKHKDRDPKPWRCDECCHKAISRESLGHHLLYVHKRHMDTYTHTVPTGPGREGTAAEQTQSEHEQALSTSSEHVATERTQTESSAGSTATGAYHNLLTAQIPGSISPQPDVATPILGGLLAGGLLNAPLYPPVVHGSLVSGAQGYTPLPQGYMHHDSTGTPCTYTTWSFS